MNDQEKETVANPIAGRDASRSINSALAPLSRRKILRLLRPSGLLAAIFLSIRVALGAEWPVLSLKEAVERALNRHAAITAAEARLESTHGLLQQARLYPNPSLIFQLENWRFGGVPAFQPSQDLDVFAYVSQRIETAGKRARRTEVGQQNTELAALELQWRRWSIRQDVRRAYYGALLAQKRLQMMVENNQSFQQIVEYHRFRVREGAMAEGDLIKVELEAERLNLDRESAALEGERSRFELLKAMGESATGAHFRLTDPGPVPVPATLAAAGSADAKFELAFARQNTLDGGSSISREAPADLGLPSDRRNPSATPTMSTSLELLLRLARQKRFDVLLSQAIVEQAKAKLTLEQAHSRPDWSVIWGYKRTAGFNTMLAGVSIPLPFFDRNQGSIASSSSELDRAQELLRATLAEVETETAAAVGRLGRRYAMLQQVRGRVLDQAEESFRISLAAYQEGGTDLLRLLDAQRARNETRLLQTQAEMAYRIGLVELEATVGEENLSLTEELLRDTQ
jgi:cobalt-zinc-cadmium efflux system outer membrane protein